MAVGYWFDPAQDVVKLATNRVQITVWHGAARGAPSEAITFILPTQVPDWLLTEVLVVLAIRKHRGEW